MLVLISSPNACDTVLYQCMWRKKKIIGKKTCNDQSNRLYAAKTPIDFQWDQLIHIQASKGIWFFMPCWYLGLCKWMCGHLRQYRATFKLGAAVFWQKISTDFNGHFCPSRLRPSQKTSGIILKTLNCMSSPMKFHGTTHRSKGFQDFPWALSS